MTVRAEDIAPFEAEALRVRMAELLAGAGERAREDAVELGALLAAAYPGLARGIDSHPEDLLAVARGQRHMRDRDVRTYRRLALTAIGDVTDREKVQRGLRRLVAREKMRIAARELQAYPGQDVDVTARELSDLADVSCEVALSEAMGWAEARFGKPLAANGNPCPFTVIGMGKLGGRELNAGSDIDLLLFYETDDGSAGSPSGGGHTLHEHFTRVAQRFVANLDATTGDGFAWRVDLRLRPEGTRGPLVNALAAAERYYETWGRTWERAALLRARPVAGDLAFGHRLLEALSPFVWRRVVEPRVVDEMAALLARARVEAGLGSREDLKIGPGGIREVEFFVQGLQLVWGGREPRVRSSNTIEGLRRLRAGGFVSEREEREMSDAYLFLRRIEHRVQFATNQQTHAIPRDSDLRERIGRSLGYDDARSLEAELRAVRARVSSRFASIGSTDAPSEDSFVERLWAALDTRDEVLIAEAAAPCFGTSPGPDLPRHLLALARRPDGPLGAATFDRDPVFASRLIHALADAADPEQAARLLAAFFSRLATPGAYVRALGDNPRLVRALCSLLGASAFLGTSIVGHPDLLDRILFARGVPTPELGRAQVDEEVGSLSREDAVDVDAFVGALRRAKRRVTFEVGLADLAGELGPLDVAHSLTALADALLVNTLRFAVNENTSPSAISPRTDVSAGGLAVIAMGTLGGREIGYGSDLDIFFVYEASDDGGPERFARIAQRVLRLMETPHGEGPGYDLDTRLRPSGTQGLLVVSLEGFARYQEERAEAWERQALVKARVCAGDVSLGERVVDIVRHAAYERGPPAPVRLHHLRGRIEREIGHERLGRSPARYDLKVGRGGLVDIEFATQWLQMRYGQDPRVRSTETEVAVSALESCGYLDPPLADVFRDGWRFLRRLEQRLRISHGTSGSLLEEGAPGLLTLARRVGMRDGPRLRADEALLERYTSLTSEVRAAYLKVLGLEQA
ncbi:MAG: bifunctional [glutamate--ammonia ligase]-adenylyl-L-tyrosine phosphorylase/[glutamate--ammonia-ligase] adenylyltransferase [Polyangiaceae bacterium]|jgi:glutamate-ammonia-ligase adenylyltransferase